VTSHHHPRRRMTVTSSEPRHLDSQPARAGTVVDTSRAVLVDRLCAARLGAGRQLRGAYALQLGGRVNQTTDRVTVTHLLDAAGLAAIVAEVLALARQGGDGELAAALAALDRPRTAAGDRP
jgi:hypothetical protein